MSCRRRSGFSLVELLIVVGIIVVLASMLLPALARAREAGRRVACVGNLRQLGIAFRSYASDNEDCFPYHAGLDETGPPWPSADWIYWQTPRNLTQSAIARYIGASNPASIFVCPSDNVLQRNRQIYAYPYPYSYSFNQLLSSNPYSNLVRITAVHNPSSKILVVEEDIWSIDDGNWSPELVGTDIENFLSIRHDRRVVNDASTAPSPLNLDCRGNVCFADGHCEFLSRRDSQSPAYYNPTQ